MATKLHKTKTLLGLLDKLELYESATWHEDTNTINQVIQRNGRRGMYSIKDVGKHRLVTRIKQ